MNPNIVLFFVLLFLTAGLLLLFLFVGRFRLKSIFVLFLILLAATVFVAIDEGSITYKIGELIITINKAGYEKTLFKIRNPTAMPVSKTVRFRSNAKIENVSFKDGSFYYTEVEGGVGNNYVVYNINIPAKSMATGSFISGDAVLVEPENGTILRPPATNE